MQVPPPRFIGGIINISLLLSYSIINPEQMVRAILVYPLTNGRNIYEILRLLTALQTTDRCKVVTPANWEPDMPSMVPPPGTYDQLIQRTNSPQDMGLSCMDWFWCYKDSICK